MTLINTDFSALELTFFFPNSEHYLIPVNSKAEKFVLIRKIRLIRVAIIPASAKRKNPCPIH